jgi:hypothetical protein
LKIVQWQTAPWYKGEMDVRALFGSSLSPAVVAGALDGLDDEERIRTVAGLGRKQLAALFEAAADNAPLALADLVPAGVPSMTEVVHEGKNSLAAFTRFQKRFCRPRKRTGELWGYNEQDLRAITGPGYFVAHDAGAGVVIDYRRLPPDKPGHWPRILPNSARLARFIYHRTVDVMRRVSDGVAIGRAYREDRPMDAWFALVRRAI